MSYTEFMKSAECTSDLNSPLVPGQVLLGRLQKALQRAVRVIFE